MDGVKRHLYYKENRIKDLPDVVFTMGTYLELIDYLSINGCLIINSYEGIKLLNNKYETSVELRGIRLPQFKMIIGFNFPYQELINNLGNPFIIRNDYLCGDKSFTLVENEKQYTELINKYPFRSFICEELISKEDLKYIRTFIVGDSIIDSLEYKYPNNNFYDDRNRNEKFDRFNFEGFKDTILSVAHSLNIEIGCIDFILKDNKLFFWKANDEDCFNDLVKYQSIIITYIINKYVNIKNIIAQKRELTRKKNSFEVIEGKLPLIISAPHNVWHVRNKKYKEKDLGTGHLLLSLVNRKLTYGIIKTNCVGKVGSLDDDPNYEVNHPYKDTIISMINNHKIKALIDLHSKDKSRIGDVNLGINKGVNIQNNYLLLERIKDKFIEGGFIVSVDHPFAAGEKTVCGTIAKAVNIFSLQIEINSKLIYLKDERNEIGKLENVLSEVIDLLNESL